MGIQCLGDAASECGTSYYSEYDPFDYLYSSSTQYSDPLYDAVNRIDHTPLSHGAPSIGWNIPVASAGSFSPPPPLPPRNSATTPPNQSAPQFSATEATYNNEPAGIQHHPPVLDRRKCAHKLYHNVQVRKTYDPELMAFFQMVKTLRSKYVASDVTTNVGHVVAAEFYTSYPAGTSIKLLVHPSLECLAKSSSSEASNLDHGQVAGYGSPVAFTCDSKFNKCIPFWIVQ